MSQKIGFLGAGKMASALAQGLVKQGFCPAQNILATDVSTEAAARFKSLTGAATLGSSIDVVREAQVLILAVKPNHVADVLTEIRKEITRNHLLISIAAGVTISQLSRGLDGHGRIVRVMPNTPSLVGQGAAAYSLGPDATPDDARLVGSLLATVGYAAQLPEHLLDAVTGLSGSGPAYGYVIIEALSDAGVRVGLPRDVATRLAAQTILGAAKMVLDTGEHPGALKDAVASPGGTTIAGLAALEKGSLRATLIDAVTAATLRSIELGQKH